MLEKLIEEINKIKENKELKEEEKTAKIEELNKQYKESIKLEEKEERRKEERDQIEKDFKEKYPENKVQEAMKLFDNNKLSKEQIEKLIGTSNPQKTMQQNPFVEKSGPKPLSEEDKEKLEHEAKTKEIEEAFDWADR